MFLKQEENMVCLKGPDGKEEYRQQAQYAPLRLKTVPIVFHRMSTSRSKE